MAAETIDINAEPFPFPARPEALALIVIDMQRDFAEPGGKKASAASEILTPMES